MSLFELIFVFELKRLLNNFKKKTISKNDFCFGTETASGIISAIYCDIKAYSLLVPLFITS